MKLLGIGFNGLIGSGIESSLQKNHSLIQASRSTGVDITSFESVVNCLKKSDADVVILAAAKADVDGCEKDKQLGEKGDAWAINVGGVETVVRACEEFNKRLIYISTDFVFDGKKEKEEQYSETDLAVAINWYGYTKREGEKRVERATIPWSILRIAYPYGFVSAEKKDFISSVMRALSEGKKVKGVVDHLMVPTFLEDIGYAIDQIATHMHTGIYHVVGSETITPYEVIEKVIYTFGFSNELLEKTTREEFFLGRAPRPFNLSLKNDKIIKLKIPMRGFSQGLKEMEKMRKV